MKSKDERPLATPEAAERKLLEIANAIAGGCRSRSSTRNFEMLEAAPRSTVLRLPPQSRIAGSCCIRPALT